VSGVCGKLLWVLQYEGLFFFFLKKQEVKSKQSLVHILFCFKLKFDYKVFIYTKHYFITGIIK